MEIKITDSLTAAVARARAAWKESVEAGHSDDTNPGVQARREIDTDGATWRIEFMSDGSFHTIILYEGAADMTDADIAGEIVGCWDPEWDDVDEGIPAHQIGYWGPDAARWTSRGWINEREERTAEDIDA